MPCSIVTVAGVAVGLIMMVTVCYQNIKGKTNKIHYFMILVAIIFIAMPSGLDRMIFQIGKFKVDVYQKIDQVQIAVDKQKSDMERLVNCAEKNINIKITEPTLHQVSSPVDVRGSSAYNETCRWAYVLVKDKEKEAQPWIVKDIVQISRDGHWAGRVMLDSIPKGGEADLVVGVSYLPNIYGIYQSLDSLPDKIYFSSVVNLRKTK